MKAVTDVLINYRPEGTYAVITKHGEFLEIKKEGGIYFCMPYVSSKMQFMTSGKRIKVFL